MLELRGDIASSIADKHDEETLPMRADAPEPAGTLTVYAARGETTVIDSYTLEAGEGLLRLLAGSTL